MKIFWALLLSLGSTTLCFAENKTTKRDTLTWELLNKLEYFEAPHAEYGTVYLPKFDKSLKKIHQKDVIIRGYLVPVDKTTWALGKFTYAACFFCGKAGPETVLGITWKNDPGKLRMDSNALIKGRIIINATDVDDWMYQIVDAEIISIKK